MINNFLVYLISIIVALFLCVLGYFTNRWFNWTFSYKTQTEELIRAAVKPECLKDK